MPICAAAVMTCCAMPGQLSAPHRRPVLVGTWPISRPIIASGRLSVPSPAPLADLLLALSQVLADLRAGWYIFGAQAVLYWGRPRLTEDVDVTVQLGSTDVRDLVTRLQHAGFTMRVEGTAAFVAATRVLPLTFGDSGWALDIVIGGPGLEEEFVARAVQVEMAPGLTVPVIAAEDLVVTKVLAGRSKDIDDIRGILVAQAGRLDMGAIRGTLAALESALGVSDLLPLFNQLTAR